MLDKKKQILYLINDFNLILMLIYKFIKVKVKISTGHMFSKKIWDLKFTITLIIYNIKRVATRAIRYFL